MSAAKNMSSRLRHRLTLQQEMRTDDGAGGYVKSWEDVADLWGEIVSLSGSDSKLNATSGKKILYAGQLQGMISHKVTLRYRDGVTSAMRLVFEERIFNIRYVANTEERREKLELLVQEGIAT
jgi:SPP1 family predicted phage head-tail adaptor